MPRCNPSLSIIGKQMSNGAGSDPALPSAPAPSTLYFMLMRHGLSIDISLTKAIYFGICRHLAQIMSSKHNKITITHCPLLAPFRVQHKYTKYSLYFYAFPG